MNTYSKKRRKKTIEAIFCQGYMKIIDDVTAIYKIIF